MKHIFVTGGNDGIGFALCKQLAADGHFVYLGSRSAEKGVAAVAAIGANATLVVCDVTSDSSVVAAAAAVQGLLGGAKLYGIVNNAGTGLAHGGGAELILNTNLHGPKRVTDAFLPLLDTPGRVVMVGSGAGPGFIKGCSDAAIKRVLIGGDATWDQIVGTLDAGVRHDRMQGYGLSKAALCAYTMLLARTHPQHVFGICSPGFIATKMAAQYGAKKPCAAPQPAPRRATAGSTARATALRRRSERTRAHRHSLASGPRRAPSRSRSASSTCLRRRAAGTTAATACARRCISCATRASRRTTAWCRRRFWREC